VVAGREAVRELPAANQPIVGGNAPLGFPARSTGGRSDSPQQEVAFHASDIEDLQENIRIDRGRCVARCYRVAEMFAMWLIDVGVLQFYDADGEMLHTVNLFTELQPQRVAA